MSGDALSDRLRAALTGRDVREVSMFGGTAFMVGGRLLVSSRRGGDLLVRIDPARREQLLARPGATPAEMGTGRRMGDAWLVVAAEHLDGAHLAEWLDLADHG